MKRFRFDKILYIVLGAILCIGGVLLLPALTNWFDQILGIIAGSLLLIYLIVSSLFIKDLNKVGKIISICELFVYLVLGVVSIISDIKDFDFFVAEKWKIASDRQGSGNTANIGSINDIEDLKEGKGVFSSLGEQFFDEYWMNFGEAVLVKDGKPRKIRNIRDFLEFKGRLDLLKKIDSKYLPRL